jgi:catechol 2,3-dioxygenase-like lactoylglutathione lyase family enzyme
MSPLAHPGGTVTLRIGGFATLIQVFDMPTSLGFYRDVMGFEIISDVPEDGLCDWVWLKSGESELMLNTAYEADARPTAPDPARLAAHADTTLYFGCDDVDAAHAELRARGVATRAPIVSDYGMKQIYLSDPDGYEICLQQRADSNAA